MTVTTSVLIVDGPCAGVTYRYLGDVQVPARLSYPIEVTETTFGGDVECAPTTLAGCFIVDHDIDDEGRAWFTGVRWVPEHPA